MRRMAAFILSLLLVAGLVPAPALGAVASAGTAAGAARGLAAAAEPADAELYGDVTVRRFYTRSVTLFTSPDSGQKLYRTVELDLSNPLYDGCDIAIRYTGDTPYLMQADADWGGWVRLGAGDDGVSTETVNAATGEKVTVYSRAAYEARWAAKGTGKDSVHLYACVSPSSASNPDRYEECRIVEIVMLGGPDRIDPTESSSYHQVKGRSALEIARDMRAGYNFAGHFESNWVPSTPTKDGGWGYTDLASEAHWSRGVYITPGLVRSLKASGFSAIRIPVTWFQHIYPEGDPAGTGDMPDDPVARYHIDRAWLERVHEVVDWCIAEDLYVIVNIHHEDWIDRPDLGSAYDESDLPQKFAAVWTQIAQEFSGYDQHLVFEDMNEPHAYFYHEDGTKDWGFATEETVSTVNRLNADFVNLMRTSFPAESGHGERVLMMAHDTGNGDISQTGFVMPDDPAHNLAYSVHVYSPHDWTHYFAENKHQGETGEANVYSPTYRAAVESSWASIRANYTAQGYAVIGGEFGCYYLGENRQQDRSDWMEQYATHAKELGIPLFYWSMDNTVKDDDGAEHVIWSAFDEEQLKVSDLSKDMLAKWFEVLGDDSIRWGSMADIVDGEHSAMTDDNKVAASSFPRQIRYVEDGQRGTDQSWRITLPLTWSHVQGNEVAVKFTGNTPRLGLVRSSADEQGKAWQGNWWGFAPDTVDMANHIAYFKAETVKANWERSCPTYDLSTLSHIVLRVADSGYSPPTPEDVKLSTTIEAVALVHEHEWGRWTVTREPAAGAPGEEIRVCARDSSHVLRREIPAPAEQESPEEPGGPEAPRDDEPAGDDREPEADPAPEVDPGSDQPVPVPGPAPTPAPDPAPAPEPVPVLDPVTVPDSAPPAPASGQQAPSGSGQDAPPAPADVIMRAGSAPVAVKRVGAGKVSVISGGKSAAGTVKLNTVRSSDGRTLKVASIGNFAFKGTRMSKVVIGANVVKVGKEAFRNCRNLKSAEIGKNVKAVGAHAFSGCLKLKTVKLRSAKLGKLSFKRLVSAPRLKAVKLVGMSKVQKEAARARYAKWLPSGIGLK